MRLVVVGGSHAGKTTLINSVLGQHEPEPGRRTVSCMRREGEVDGRKLIFVDTPGWWRNYPLMDTAEFRKQQLMLSPSMCPPGPHAFVLVIGTDISFTEKNRRSVAEHLGLFGENVWEHTLVVITGVDRSKEEHIDSEGGALKWVTDKCMNRYHIFENDSMTEPQRINQLLEKIECIIAKNSGSYFPPDEKVLKEVEEKRKLNQEKAISRRRNVKSQKETLRKQAQVLPLPEVQILLLGWVCSGKTSAKNIILNKREILGMRRTDRSDGESVVAGRKITVVDTPGWWRYLSAQFTPAWVKTELRRSVTLDGKNPHAILLAIPADTTFREEQRKITEYNMKMFGQHVWRHTIVLFTSGDLLGDTTIEEHIESEGEPLRWLVEKCGNRYHVLGKGQDEESPQVTELLMKIEEMVARKTVFSLCEETQTPIEEMTVKPNKTNADMVKFLDQEWNRMDKEMEETLKNMYSQTFQVKGNRSNDWRPNFHDSKPSSDASVGERSKCSGPLTTDQTTSESEGEAGLSGQAEGEVPQTESSKNPEDPLEEMRETLEREWGRREMIVTERFRGILSGQQTFTGPSSEADEHDRELSRRKVLRWLDNASGYGSGEGLDNKENE